MVHTALRTIQVDQAAECAQGELAAVSRVRPEVSRASLDAAIVFVAGVDSGAAWVVTAVVVIDVGTRT